MTKSTGGKRKKPLRSPASKLAKARRSRECARREDGEDTPGSPGSPTGTSLVRIFDDQALELHNLVANRSGYFSQRASGSTKSVSELGISLANESELRASVARLPERLQPRSNG